MSEAYYVLVFGFATDAFYDLIGMDDAFRCATRTSVYTVEAHVRYLREATEGQALDIESWCWAMTANGWRCSTQCARGRRGRCWRRLC